jgi:hypothetical protein
MLIYARFGRLPAAPAEAEQGWSRQLELVDPVAARPYEYRAMGADAYELCAVFDLASGPDIRRWAHGAGRHCFTRQVARGRNGAYN